MKLTAKTFFGLEEVLAEELKNLGATNIQKGNRVVTFEGDLELMYRSNLWLRTALAILIPVSTFKFKNKDDLFKKFTKIDFGEYMSDGQTFAVKGAVNSPEFTYTQLPMLILKDAIVDYFRDKFGTRPNVDKRHPNVVFDVHLQDYECTVSINTSGAPLFQRGYRKDTGEAPLNEAVAAGMILLSGWKGDTDFMDVMCGAGTLPIEAALIANEMPPNLARKNYSFMHLKGFDKELWQKVYDEAPKRPKRDLGVRIVGSDTNGDVILKARSNAKNLPLGQSLQFEIKDFGDQERLGDEGILITNPPYGERIGEEEEIPAMYKRLGDFFKHKMQGYDCWVISASRDGLKNIELKPDAKIQLYNGSLSCDFRKYKIFPGSLAEHKQKYSNERRVPKRNKK